MTSVLITAGFDKAKNAIALAELLHRDSVEVRGILVVTPFSLKRLKLYVRQRGWNFIGQAIKRITGKKAASSEDLIDQLLKQNNIQFKSLKTWAKERAVPYHLVNSLNSEESVQITANSNADWVIYGGGGILHDSFIDAAGGRILNAHHGPLPEIRGMNAVEWSLLLGYPPHVTVHIINRGIDTGGSFAQYPVPVHSGDNIGTLRNRATVIGVEALVGTIKSPPSEKPKLHSDESRQCFILAPVILELLQQRLYRSEVPGLSE